MMLLIYKDLAFALRASVSRKVSRFLTGFSLPKTPSFSRTGGIILY